jgi:uncharacterized membrane protein
VTEALLVWAACATLFLAVDAVMLGRLIGPFFRRRVGHLLDAPPALGPALAFYLLYVAGLVWLVVLPAGGAAAKAAGEGAVLGALAYGTYEFVNKATLRGWRWSMVALDTGWGAALTAGTAGFGAWIARLIE